MSFADYQRPVIEPATVYYPGLNLASKWTWIWLLGVWIWLHLAFDVDFGGWWLYFSIFPGSITSPAHVIIGRLTFH